MRNLDAAELPRVLACNGSLSMEAVAVSIDTPSEDREEGNAAHYVAAVVLNGQFSDPVEWVDRAAPNGVFITPEIAENVGKYIDVLSARSYDATARLGVEQNVDFDMPGTDIVIRARPDWYAYDEGSGTLDIDVLKMGYRTVEPEDNWTLIAYAIGVCRTLGITPTKVNLTIHQPRKYHPDGMVRTAPPISGEELTAFAVTLGFALANLTDDLITGPHCRNCKALATCPAAQKAAFNSIEAASIPYNDTIPDHILSFEITNLRRGAEALKLKLEAYENLAMHRKKDDPTSLPDWDIERGLGNRTFVAGTTPEFLSIMTGKTIDEVSTRKLATPAALERLGVSEAVIKPLTYRPPTGEKLVPFNATKAAQRLFAKPPKGK